MKEADKKEIESLENEIQELLIKDNKENRHRRYLNIGAIVGIIFMFISTPFENEFYRFFGTFGMGLIQAVTGLCVLMAVIFIIARFNYGKDNMSKYEIDRKKKD